MDLNEIVELCFAHTITVSSLDYLAYWTGSNGYRSSQVHILESHHW